MPAAASLKYGARLFVYDFGAFDISRKGETKMLYITLDKNIQQAYVPRNGFTSQPVSLEAVSTSDRGIGASFAIHEVQTTGAFFLITLGLMEGLHEGEWEWTLTLDDGNTVNGLMQVVDSQDEAAQYNKEIQYKQYGE